MRKCLQDDDSKQALDGRLPQEAIDTLFERLAGRFRPAAVAIEKIIEGNEQGAWKFAIEDTEQVGIFGTPKHQSQSRAVTALDKPFVSRAVENYIARDPYFKKETRQQMRLSTSGADQGSMFEHFMKSVFSETFNTRPLSEWPHHPPISEMCEALVGKVEIVGWRDPGLEQGMTHKNMSMEEFMDAHVNHQLTRNNKAVTPFFFPKSKPSGPDMVFFIRIDDKDGTCICSAQVASKVIKLFGEGLERRT